MLTDACDPMLCPIHRNRQVAAGAPGQDRHVGCLDGAGGPSIYGLGLDFWMTSSDFPCHAAPHTPWVLLFLVPCLPDADLVLAIRCHA